MRARIISIFLILILLITTIFNDWGEICLSVKAEELQNPLQRVYFNPDQYRAEYLLDTSDSVSEKVLENLEKSMENLPAERLVEISKKNELQQWDTVWRLFTDLAEGTQDITKLIDKAQDQKDLYSGIILNIFDCSEKIELIDLLDNKFINEVNELLGTLNKTYSYVKEDEIYAKTKCSTLSRKKREKIKKTITDHYDNKAIPMSQNLLSNILEFFDHADTVEGFCEEVVSFILIRDMNDSIKTVLKEMKVHCPKTNIALSMALDDCVKILDQSQEEFEKQMVKGGLIIAGTEVFKVLLSKFWKDHIASVILKNNPKTLIFKMMYEASKYICNELFSTDEQVEKYIKLVAATQVDIVVRDTYHSLKDEYLNEKNEQNAKNYLTSIDIMFQTIENDCKAASEFVDCVNGSSASIMMNLLFSYTQILGKTITLEKNQRLELYHNTLINWVYELEEDYPEEFEYYADLLNISGTSDSKNTKEYQIHCPVDVYVYDHENQLVASVINNIPYSTGLSVLVKDDHKTILIPEEDMYHFKYVGTDTGKMSIQISEYDGDMRLKRTVNFNDIKLTKKRTYTSSEQDEDKDKEEECYELKTEKNKSINTNYDSAELVGDKDSKQSIKVVGGLISKAEEPFCEVNACEGETLELRAIVPEGYKFEKWIVVSGDVQIEDKHSIFSNIIMGEESSVLEARMVEKR